MPGTINNTFGKIVIEDEIIARIAGYAAIENYGIVGMKAKTAQESIISLVGGSEFKRGVKVASRDDGLTFDIDLFVTLIYGVTLPAVAMNIMNNVRYKVEELTGFKVGNVNIHVESIRV